MANKTGEKELLDSESLKAVSYRHATTTVAPRKPDTKEQKTMKEDQQTHTVTMSQHTLSSLIAAIPLAEFAAMRLASLDQERAAILSAFPDAQIVPPPTPKATNHHKREAAPTKKESGMSAAARKATSDRMKAYWRKRRRQAKAGNK